MPVLRQGLLADYINVTAALASTTTHLAMSARQIGAGLERRRKTEREREKEREREREREKNVEKIFLFGQQGGWPN